MQSADKAASEWSHPQPGRWQCYPPVTSWPGWCGESTEGGGHLPVQWQACGPGPMAHGAGASGPQGYGQLAGLQYVPKGPQLLGLKYQHLAGVGGPGWLRWPCGSRGLKWGCWHNTCSGYHWPGGSSHKGWWRGFLGSSRRYWGRRLGGGLAGAIWAGTGRSWPPGGGGCLGGSRPMGAVRGA